jgi:hypothetical protein
LDDILTHKKAFAIIYPHKFTKGLFNCYFKYHCVYLLFAPNDPYITMEKLVVIKVSFELFSSFFFSFLAPILDLKVFF